MDEKKVKTIYCPKCGRKVGTYDGKSIPGIQESCYSHMIVFAAEQARATDTVVNVEEYIASL